MTPVLLNPAVVWDSLMPQQQRRIGIAAIVASVGASGVHRLDGQAYRAAALAGGRALAVALWEAAKLDNTAPRPDLSVIGVRACRACGCTDQYGPSGAWWVTEDRCSTCFLFGPRRPTGRTAAPPRVSTPDQEPMP